MSYIESRERDRAKAKTQTTEIKSVQVKIGTGEHDLELKAKKASEWLKEGHRVKIDLFQEEVYVFTPKGDVKVFPRGSTPIDYAYSIHSKLGDHIVGARVNGKLEQLRYKLRNGDVIEVVTANTQQPSKGWLDFVITTRARTRIRNWLRQEEREKSIRLGRELLERECQRHSISLTKLLKDDHEVRRMTEALKVQTFDELLLALGYGRIDAHDVIDVIAPQSDDGKALVPSSIKENAVARAVRKVINRDDGAIVLNGIDDMLVRYAKCCSPLPGEDILGFITRGRGITVHRRGCGKAFDADPERRVEITWDAKAKIDREVQIKVTATNKTGILADVGQTFSDLKVNVIEANCRAGDDGRAISLFTFNCSDMAKLRDVMRAIGKVRGVTAVERI